MSWIDRVSLLLGRNLKLENERENAPSTATEADPDNSPDALQRALERRQDLLNRLRDEKLNETRTPSPMYRPRSYGGHRHRRLLTPIRTARSLPDIQVYRHNDAMPHRQIVEHQITSQIPPPPPPPPPQPVVQPIVNQMPQPIVNQVPPQPIVNQIPPQNPLIHNVYPPAPPENRNSAFLNRNDMVDMMMMQNAQMHQIVMQQMMFQHLPMKQPQQQQPQQVSMPVQVMQEPPAPVVVQAPGGGKRPPSVHHHHHYSSVQQPAVQYQAAPQPQPVVSHITQLPPLQPRRVYRNIPPPPPPSATQTVGPDYQPQTAKTKTPVRKRSKKQPTPTPTPPQPTPVRPRTVVTPPKSKETPAPKPPTPQPPARKIPFPGPPALRKLRHIFYAAWFVAFLKAQQKKNREKRLEEEFLFGIHLKEAVSALHRIYLNPEGPVNEILRTAVLDGTIDTKRDARGSVVEFVDSRQAIPQVCYIIENLTYNITEIMPDKGVLGTNKKASIFHLVQDRKTFPKGYFWQLERAELEFDALDRTVRVNKRRAAMLVLGMYLSRGLITTLLMKPLDYGLSTTMLDDVGERNLKMLATLFLNLVRRASVPAKEQPWPVPVELQRFIYSDEEMRQIYSNSKIKKSLEYAEKLLRDWAEEYVKRLIKARDPDDE
ncbi:uncharacterized protein [Branchiostoma lanceolatum]|uniref:uncharacterized protein isoform X2 n=1 Tax=Branchiostoma lanceolatum TaxID=7740 RepID=UPI003455D907